MEYLDIQDNILLECTDKKILTAVIPDGITEISENAFADCTHLVSVDFPPTLKKIGDGAFYSCVKLKTADLSNVSILGAYAFSGCLSLCSVTLGNNIGYLPNGIFSDCTMLEEIKLPENITYIGCECFKNCVSVTSVDMDNVMEIDTSAFFGCENLYGITLPSSLLHISSDTFSNCNNLKDVTVRNRLIYIDDDAFNNTKDITIRAAQFSAAYKYAIDNKHKCQPTILDSSYREIDRKCAEKLNQAGIMFQMKPCPDNSDKAIIRFDSSQTKEIESILGGIKDDK
ncbi:MAG: leucine-rich repeat domain-containing protein [Clostridia bacterium]|nr:leucine-rich repeat domain-containing protein [Clostridia bacterium]